MSDKLPERSKAQKDDHGLTVVQEPKIRIKTPSLYKVLLLNDDYTPMEFVIEVLLRFFGMTQDDATRVMMNVHNQGKGICGVFPKDIAETKAAMVTEYARQKQHPLQCTVEKA